VPPKKRKQALDSWIPGIEEGGAEKLDSEQEEHKSLLSSDISSPSP
jgi:hypothetical protein